MPKSKRNKAVSLTRATAKGKPGKQRLIDEIRKCLDSYQSVFVFAINNMRTTFLKDVRERWRSSRIFMGKNKVMQVALGKLEEEEYKPAVHKVSENLRGTCGLFFTNETEEAVMKFFQEFKEMDYARSGFVATETVTLPAGPLPYAHSMEPYLRNELGMPTALKNAVVNLEKEFTVCRQGEKLTPESARILVLMEHKMCEFSLDIICRWSEGKFKQYKTLDNQDQEEVDEDDE